MCDHILSVVQTLTELCTLSVRVAGCRSSVLLSQHLRRPHPNPSDRRSTLCKCIYSGLYYISTITLLQGRFPADCVPACTGPFLACVPFISVVHLHISRSCLHRAVHDAHQAVTLTGRTTNRVSFCVSFTGCLTSNRFRFADKTACAETV